jgi:hypothetical protein
MSVILWRLFMIELKRTGSQLCLSPTMWMLTIEMARVCGWKPGGTIRLDDDEGAPSPTSDDLRHLMAWQTDYLSSDGQTVSAPDAGQLADALQKAVIQGDRILTDWSEGRTGDAVDVRTKPSGFRWFNTSQGRAHLFSIANFCRGGAFQIF